MKRCHRLVRPRSIISSVFEGFTSRSWPRRPRIWASDTIHQSWLPAVQARVTSSIGYVRSTTQNHPRSISLFCFVYLTFICSGSHTAHTVVAQPPAKSSNTVSGSQCRTSLPRGALCHMCASSCCCSPSQGVPGHSVQHRSGHLSAAHAFTANRGSYCSRYNSSGFKLLAALPDPSTAATATSTPQTAATTSPMISAVDNETLRLVTAATILSYSDSESDTDTADPISSIGADSTPLTHPLSYLDELTSLDADSLSLTIGILRQQQPVNVQDADVQLSERLRDLLVLLHRRPGSVISSRSTSRSASPPLGSSPSSSDVFVAAEDDGFWSTGDDWSDVRCALMSIGINASLDEDDDDDDDEEDVWTLEEEGPARRWECSLALSLAQGTVLSDMHICGCTLHDVSQLRQTMLGGCTDI